MIAFDFETHLISNEHPAPRPVCVSYYDGKVEGLARKAEMAPLLKHILNSPLSIAHNMKFESAVIWEWFPELRPDLIKAFEEQRLMCTKINEQLMDCQRKNPVPRYSLADLVMKYLKEDISSEKTDPDAWRMRYSELEDVDVWPDRAIRYAIMDSVYAYKLAEIQIMGIKGLDVYAPVYTEFCLTQMSQKGLMIDKDRVIELENEILNKMGPWRETLLNAGMMRKDKAGKLTKNAKGFQAHLLETVKDVQYTATRAVSTSGESLAAYKVMAPDDAILDAYINILEYEKVLTTYTSRLKTADPVIRTEYSAVKRTGRTSSRTTDAFPSVNIQQMPRETRDVKYDVRNCFVPRPGYKFFSIDYSGLELASAASQLFKYYGEGAMLEALNAGSQPTDLHSKLAARIMSLKEGKIITYDEFVKNKNDKPYSTMRTIAKQVNLGYPGGLGYKTTRTLLFNDGVMTKYFPLKSGGKVIKFSHEDEANFAIRKFRHDKGNSQDTLNLRVERTGRKEYIIVYDELIGMKTELFEMYPELGTFLRDDHKLFLTGETKKVKNEFGEWEDEPMYRYEIEGFIRNYCTYTEFCNGYLMQSPSAVGAKKAVCGVVKEFLNRPEVVPLAFIHDEIIGEVKDCDKMKDYVEEVGLIMIDRMRDVMSNVRIAVEVNVMDYWQKQNGFYTAKYFKG